MSALVAIAVLQLTLASEGARAEAPRRSVAHYQLPPVTLVDQDGSPVRLGTLVDPARPAFVQFIFTTCTTICPVLGALFSSVQRSIGASADALPFVSISIDPEHDTPEKMKAFLKRYDAHANWRFVTGSRADIITVAKAFEAFANDKMTHAPLTFMWSPSEQAWVRLKGFVSTAELVAEYQRSLVK
jgi:protein SCO1/2